MPIYEYRCKEGDCWLCGGVVELFQKMDSPPVTDCPYCRQPVERLLSTPQPPIMSRADTIRDSRLAEGGFTKYVNAGGGRFEKAAGPDEAPAVLDRATIEHNVQTLLDTES